jgi:hypothetical protein
MRDLPEDLDVVDEISYHRGDGCQEQEVLPPYLEEPPAYSSSGSNEPVMLAMYLFKFGFREYLFISKYFLDLTYFPLVFPPFWVMGALILLSPLRQPESNPSSVWLPEKTESERREIIQKMRATEVKWAKRCLVAFSILSLLIVVGTLAIWGVLRS